MRRYQSHSRIVFATGQNDLPNRAQDEDTRASFVDYCVIGGRTHLQRRLDHWIPDRRGFATATLDSSSTARASALGKRRSGSRSVARSTIASSSGGTSGR